MGRRVMQRSIMFALPVAVPYVVNGLIRVCISLF